MVDFRNSDGAFYGTDVGLPGNGDGNYQMNNNFSSIDYNMNPFAQNPSFLGPNDDLNSFFSTGLTPLGKAASQSQWDNGGGEQMFGESQEFPFPFQATQMQQPLAVHGLPQPAAWTGDGGPAHTAPVPNVEQPDQVAEPEKPKRGRPRKRKRKDPLSEAEQQRKREAFLERNRRAASKCRKRKKESTETIQARAQQLEREARFLAAELMAAREEHATWLSMALTHAKQCPDNSEFHASLREAEERMASWPDPTTSARPVDWSKYHNQSGASSRSGSMSPSEINQGRTSFDDESECGRNELLISTEQSFFPQPIPDGEIVVSPVDLQLDIAMTRQSSYQSLAGSHISSAMTRKNSSSSSGNASANSSNTSFDPTPKSEEERTMPLMLPNPRIANSETSAGVIVEKMLRSGKTIVCGPTDLDDPSVYLQKNIAT